LGIVGGACMSGEESYNIYCDESCHILHDHNDIMALGAVTVPKKKVRSISKNIRKIKQEYNCNGELKWTKVSQKNTLFYIALVDYFFSNAELSFRALVVGKKHSLDHEQFNDGSHDSFYYKMYFYLIRNIVENRIDHTFEIYIDIKDTRSGEKVYKLNDVLAYNFRDFEKKQVYKIQQIRSHESELLQLADLLLGAITYENRGLHGNPAKQAIVQRMKDQLGISLRESTPPWESKFNLFRFAPRESF
jgi:hypothetical protein